MKKVRIDLIGRRFGMLIVLRFEGRSKDGAALWRCRCDCGREHVAFGQELRRSTTHCGCKRYPKRSIAERFWEKVDVRGEDECWLWTAATVPFGYGRFVEVTTHGHERLRNAHAIAWELTSNQRIESGQIVMHTCDNPPCCNPQHLRLGTQADNIRDMVKKGRAKRGRLQGEDHGRAKLTTSDVLAIRMAHEMKAMAYPEMAEVFGVSASTIERVVNRRTWTHVA